MRLGTKILLALSRAPDSKDYLKSNSDSFLDGSLHRLYRGFPSIEMLISGKRIVDFGCGIGNQCIALVKLHDCMVVGVDTNRETLGRAIENARYHEIPVDRLSFVESIPDDMKGTFDVVVSQNSFEHYDDPVHILNEMKSLLSDSGKILITFGPPWFAPYGSHMHFFCRVPWINVFFSEKSVMEARSLFRQDGARRYEEVESGLNKMTIAKFESIVSSSGLELLHRKYECVKGLDWLARLPFLREFFIINAAVALAKQSGRGAASN